MRPITGRDFARMFVVGFLIPMVLSVGGTIIGLVLHAVTPIAIGMVAAVAAGMWAVWHFLQRGWTLRDFGFIPLTKRGWHLLWQSPLMLVACLVIAVALGSLLQVEPTQEENKLDLVAPEYVPAAFLALVLLSVIAGPIWEEFIFRRFLMGWLDTRFGMPIVSILVNSVAFGLVHLVPPIVIWAMLLGICNSLLVRWHKSLWAGIIHHGFNNFLVSLGMIITYYS